MRASCDPPRRVSVIASSYPDSAATSGRMGRLGALLTSLLHDDGYAVAHQHRCRVRWIVDDAKSNVERSARGELAPDAELEVCGAGARRRRGECHERTGVRERKADPRPSAGRI